ncbi:MAG: hypothetical protein HC855_11070 [Rhizobiales bacterium]|nr:hypothetical protein [Hyphomicrobiales bacterium]
MSDVIRVIFFQDGDAWLAQGLEHDICVQADTLDELYGRFEVAVRLESEPSGNLDHIGEAPKHFFDLWEKRSGSFTPRNAKSESFEFAMAA